MREPLTLSAISPLCAGIGSTPGRSSHANVPDSRRAPGATRTAGTPSRSTTTAALPLTLTSWGQ